MYSFYTFLINAMIMPMPNEPVVEQDYKSVTVTQWLWVRSPLEEFKYLIKFL